MPHADPLSEVLSLLSAKSLLSASLRASGKWSLQFANEDVKFNAVIHGSCWLVSPTLGAPVRLEAGDCFLITRCGGYVLCSDRQLPPIPAREVFPPDAAAWLNPGGDDEFFAIGGRITLDEADAGLLLDALPPILHIDGRAPEAPAIRWLLTRLCDEWAGARPGGTLAADHLAQLLFVEAIRAWLRSASGPTAGWLNAISDRRVGAAMRLLHSDPARRWMLQELAAAAGMSRSNFALRFKELAGRPPLDYLLRWRMRLGAKALRASAEPISTISFALGYQSESAFSNAFKRVTGMAPRQYRRTHQRPVALSELVAR
ncbi:MAG: AraC family transcriptional regulator [Janthinobacterium lividum]